jgi:hypothetical protein
MDLNYLSNIFYLKIAPAARIMIIVTARKLGYIWINS